MSLSHGTTTSLVSKLNAALDSFDSGRYEAATNQLNSFIDEVNAQGGKGISQSQAQLLIGDAQNIRNAIDILETAG